MRGFRNFMMRGNVAELAVAVVIGTAFTALVAAVTKALIQPLINRFLGGGVKGGTLTVRGQVFDFGLVINALITFVITAAVVYFLVVVPIRRIAARRREGQEPAAELSSQEQLLTEIRDLLAGERQGVPAQRTPNAPTRAEP